MRLLGPCVRSLPPAAGLSAKPLYLTFDDGPDSDCTEAVLTALAVRGVKATFFVIADAARLRPDLLRRIVAGGHSVGNHSLDHQWRPFFGSRQAMLRWIRDSEAQLADLLGHATVGFRSPAGVRTPQLAWALRELNMPLIHWNVRFYDAVHAWRLENALASLSRTQPGSIVLLHDRQRPDLRSEFLETLDAYLAAATAAHFDLRAIRAGDCPLPRR